MRTAFRIVGGLVPGVALYFEGARITLRDFRDDPIYDEDSIAAEFSEAEALRWLEQWRRGAIELGNDTLVGEIDERILLMKRDQRELLRELLYEQVQEDLERVS